MLFTDPHFFLLFLVTFVLYYLPPLRSLQVPILLGASFFFYGYGDPPLLFLLVGSIAINSLASFQVERAANRHKFAWAASGVAINLAILGFFKYAGFLTNSLLHLAPSARDGVASALLNITLPIGISFYTFEGISLLLDVLHTGAKRDSAQHGSLMEDPSPGGATVLHRLRNTSLFMAFFPHLVAGPILRAKQFYPQILPKEFRAIHWDCVFRSLVTGYFLKTVVADNLKDYTAAMAYPHYLPNDSVTNAVLLFGYSMQIFADFAGYSLIAIGLGAAFGYVLPQNFNLPYISRSLSEFWTRWHISLSSWLRDYLYFPLGGNRRGHARTYLNLFIVMALGGLWHGAAWSYVLWGCFHGLGLATERLFCRKDGPPAGTCGAWPRLLEGTRALGVFLFVTLGWAFFKLTDFHHALGFLGSIARLRIAPNLSIILPVVLFSLPVLAWHARGLPWERGRRPLAPWVESCAFALMLVLIALNRGTSTAFIYFQF